MLEIKSLDDVRGNNVVIYSIKTLMERKCFPKLSIMSGVMGVGKTSVARVVAQQLDKTGMPVNIYNCGMQVDMNKIQEEVFALKPSQPKAFIFEEIHGLQKSDQNALLQMFDTQSPNTYIICTTTEIHRVIRTIRSRAQVWEFKLLSEKQCAQLLDDYLTERGASMSTAGKQSLLRACHGVPRDLIKNADFALEGGFDSAQLDALLGNVSDELTYAIFVSLKSKTSDFVAHIEELMEDASSGKLAALNDFWLRFLLERQGGSQHTLPPPMINTLNQLYTDEEINKISKMLLRAQTETILLELLSLNMTLTGNNQATVLGVQKDDAMRAENDARIERQTKQSTPESAQLTRSSIKGFTL